MVYIYHANLNKKNYSNALIAQNLIRGERKK